MSAASTPAGRRGQFRRFIGVSLGGGRGKTTAVARLELDPETGVLTLAEARARWGQRGGGEVADRDDEHGEAAFRDDVLLHWLGDWLDDHSVVAFDAPLTLPPCVRCQLACPGIDACEVPVVVWMRTHAGRLSIRTGRSDPSKPAVTPYTQRATELLLERATLQPREALGQGMGPLAARATYLRRALSPRLRLHENLIEVHPRATLIRRFGLRDERKARQGEVERTWETRKQMLDQLGQIGGGLAFDRVWPELVVRNVHVFHAVVAAFTAWLWAREGWRGPVDLLEDLNRDPNRDPNRPDRFAAPIAALGDLWVEDGWIWTPPGRS